MSFFQRHELLLQNRTNHHFNEVFNMLPDHSKRKASTIAFSIALLVAAQSAAANDSITIASKIPYQNDQVGTPAIRSECTWNSDVPAAVVAQSKGEVIATDQDLASVHGKKLVINVTSIHAVGGIFSGPKWIALSGDLSDDGKLLGHFNFRRASSSGKMTACSTLDYIGKALTKDILNWLKNPTPNAAPADSSDTSEGKGGQ